MYLPHDRHRGHLNKLEPRYHGPGIYLGIFIGTGEVFIGTKDGLVTAYAFKRLPVPERFQVDILNGVVGVPWKTRPGAAQPDDFSGEVAVEVVAAEPAAKATTTESRSDQRGTKRPLYILPDVELERFGFTF